MAIIATLIVLDAAYCTSRTATLRIRHVASMQGSTRLNAEWKPTVSLAAGAKMSTQCLHGRY